MAEATQPRIIFLKKKKKAHHIPQTQKLFKLYFLPFFLVKSIHNQ